MLLQIGVYAQETAVINQKGTRVTVRNTVVTTAPTAPSSPVQNDIWFDTTSEVTKIYDGGAWLTINLEALAKKENSVNKSTDTNLADNTNTMFPTELAVKTYVDTKFATVVDDDITSVTFDGTNLSVAEGSTNFSANLSALEESVDIAANTTLINNHISVDDDLSSTNEIQNASEVDIIDTVDNFSATTVEGALAELAANTVKSIYSDDGTLTGNRAVTQNNFDFNFDANTLVISGDDDRVGVGIETPTAKLDVNGNVRIRTLNTGTAVDNVVTADTNGNLRKLPISSIESKTSISQNTSTGTITHNSEDGSSQTANVVSTNADNNISVGSDGGAYFNNPIKAYGTLIPASNSYTASGISGATKAGAGRYTFTMATTRSSNNYPIQLTVLDNTGINNVHIYITAQSTTSFSIAIVDDSGFLGADTYVDKTFHFTILDF